MTDVSFQAPAEGASAAETTAEWTDIAPGAPDDGAPLVAGKDYDTDSSSLRQSNRAQQRFAL
jgi:hypothetical protein